MHPMHRIANMFDMLRAYVQENRKIPPEFMMHVNALHDEGDQQEANRQQAVSQPPVESAEDESMSDADQEAEPEVGASDEEAEHLPMIRGHSDEESEHPALPADDQGQHSEEVAHDRPVLSRPDEPTEKVNPEE